MSVATLKKRNSEQFPIGWKFYEPELKAGETIVSCVCAVSPSEIGGLTLVGLPIIDVDTVSQMIADGVNGHDYYVTYRVTTSVGNIFEGTILVFVREVIPT